MTGQRDVGEIVRPTVIPFAQRLRRNFEFQFNSIQFILEKPPNGGTWEKHSFIYTVINSDQQEDVVGGQTVRQ